MLTPEIAVLEMTNENVFYKEAFPYVQGMANLPSELGRTINYEGLRKVVFGHMKKYWPEVYAMGGFKPGGWGKQGISPRALWLSEVIELVFDHYLEEATNALSATAAERAKLFLEALPAYALKERETRMATKMYLNKETEYGISPDWATTSISFKGIIMNQNQASVTVDATAPILNKTFVFGQDIDGMTDAQLYSAIGKLEAEVASLGHLKNKPKKLVAQIQAKEKQIQDLVALIDGQTPEAVATPE